jgi:hypothetical protein
MGSADLGVGSRREASAEFSKKLETIRAAAKHAFPVGDIDEMLADIE